MRQSTLRLVVGYVCTCLLLLSCNTSTTPDKPSETVLSSTYNIVGQWTNSYGSVMTIDNHNSNGQFYGSYASSTGSTGNYFVVGYSPLSNSVNRPLSLSIYWQSITGGTPDPTWHWVSTMNGLIKTDSNGEITSMKLLHDMIASSLYPAVDVTMPGHYTETLEFTPVSSAGPSPPITMPTPTNSIGGLAGQWKNVSATASFQLLNLQLYNGMSAIGGYFGNSLQPNLPVIGVYDETATIDEIVSLSLTGMFTSPLDNKPITMSFGGLYDPNTGFLTLTPMLGKGVANGNDFSAVNVLPTEVFVKN